MRLRRFRPGYAEIVATLALIMASTGTAYAAGLIGTADIANGAVTTPKLANEAVSNAKLAPNAVTSADIANDTVSLADIVGINETGTISFTLAGNSCGMLRFGVSGAVAKQAALLTWTTTPPQKVVVGPLRVVDSTHIVGVACNLSSSTVSYSSVGVRVVTFG